MARKQHVDAGVRRRVEREFASPGGSLHVARLAHRQGEQRVVGNEHSQRIGIAAFERLPDEFQLLVADAAVLECQRPRRVDPEHGHSGKVMHRAEGLVDVALVARQRGQKAAEDVVQRDVVIAWHREHVMPGLAQPVEEFASFLELLDPRALGKIAADDDEVGFLLVNALRDSVDKFRVMRTEVEVG